MDDENGKFITVKGEAEENRPAQERYFQGENRFLNVASQVQRELPLTV